MEKKHPFSNDLKQFAVTLQYYSPRAYLFVRKSFGHILPHPRTLRRWYTVVEGNPGFTAEAFETIRQRAQENPVYCNLVIDEMCVKRLLEVDTQQKIYGHIDLRTNSIYMHVNIFRT